MAKISTKSLGNLPPSTIDWAQWQQQNKVIRDWGIKVTDLLKKSAQQFTKGKTGTITRPSANSSLRKKYPGIKEWKEKKLADSLKYKVHNSFGIAEGLGFQFERHGVFRHYGTGSGYKVVNGMLTRVGGGPINRTPADWFNKVIDANTNDLADDVAAVNEQLVVNSIRLRIN